MNISEIQKKYGHEVVQKDAGGTSYSATAKKLFAKDKTLSAKLRAVGKLFEGLEKEARAQLSQKDISFIEFNELEKVADGAREAAKFCARY